MKRMSSRRARKIRDLCWAEQKGRCNCCGVVVPQDEATLDHIVPKSKLRNQPHRKANFQMLCRTCNDVKEDTFGQHELELLAKNMRRERAQGRRFGDQATGTTP